MAAAAAAAATATTAAAAALVASAAATNVVIAAAAAAGLDHFRSLNKKSNSRADGFSIPLDYVGAAAGEHAVVAGAE